MRYTKGFTLIELLIVVAIIAILAAIAVPNFLEAQVRSKVSRVKADFRSISTAIESYMVDHNHYPPDHYAPQFRLEDVWELTTPIAYLTSVDHTDPFVPRKVISVYSLRGYQYFSCDLGHDPQNRGWGRILYDGGQLDVLPTTAILKSFGPNAGHGEHPYLGDDGGEWIILKADTPSTNPHYGYQIDRIYDPTNGTVSWGDIVRLSGDTLGLDQQI